MDHLQVAIGQSRIVRTADEVQRAHDVLVALILDTETRHEVLGPDDDPRVMSDMMANADVLCWLLGHGHNTTFGGNLEGLEQFIQEHGYVMIDRGRPQALVNGERKDG